MALQRPSTRIATPSFLLALVLVVGSAAPTTSRDTTSAPARVAARAMATSELQGVPIGTRSPDARPASRDAELVPADPRIAAAQPAERPPTPDMPVARPVAVAKATATTSEPARATSTYRGRNHVWIPSLGVSRSVSFFACTSKAYPGDRVYRWGCAGSNNVYLFGHAHSVFRPLHDAYVSGRLRKGMALFYAGNDGRVHRYTVRWWKVTTPDKGAWAFASQSRPSLTLQTCVGARSQYRLVVRLVRSD
jgi:sortase (surface protein transpeptidase)